MLSSFLINFAEFLNARNVDFIVADNQDITRAGLLYLLGKAGVSNVTIATDKIELAYQLKERPEAVVIMDYTLFDINDDTELMILGQRFPEAQLILFSEDLSVDFVRRVIGESLHVSVLLKESSMGEIRECIRQAGRGQRYICQHIAELLLTSRAVEEERVKLTKTETEILKDIALGMTTKEIATKRISSFHTVNTHRKNIFRKIGVNNVHEATKYAIKAGLVDSAEYYI